MRAFRLGWLFFSVGSMNELQYRANFFIQVLQSAVSVGTAIVVLALVYSHTAELNGWSEVGAARRDGHPDPARRRDPDARSSRTWSG